MIGCYELWTTGQFNKLKSADKNSGFKDTIEGV